MKVVSGVTVSEPGTLTLTITPNASTAGNYDFKWDSQVGKLYDLVSNTNLSTPPADWLVYAANADIAGTGTEIELLDVPGGGETLFFAVVEKD